MALILQDELEKRSPNGVPWLGFGTAHLGAQGERNNALRVLDEAFDQGFRYFDTARLYGEGESEFVIGEAFAAKRDQIILASKAGIIPWTDRKLLRVKSKLRRTIGLSSDPVEHLFGAFDVRQLQASFDRSLKALRTDYIDVLLLHECRLEDAQDEAVIDWAASLKNAGKIRAFGSAATLAETDRIVAAPPAHIDIVQHGFDLSMISETDASSARFQRITHSALANILPAVAERLEANPELARTLREEFEIDLSDADQLVPRLLYHSHKQLPGSPVLFSTTKPERIGSVLAGLEQAINDRDGFASRLKAILAD